ncbi:glycosyltransferase [Chlorogloea sp. CCALA 695]|uniref:glycosyltransferase n=1 Tax=Chlorogloea sp. CCALA 695 TaxID=2107693 RepID=UPI000D0585B1|nr:glycosyltransferase [Chlorogloea sp. CCALA 695]PSB31253.1 hypothetical protein C7B70_13805 [Chlorogloea sp. CCALA 695]
MPKLLFVTTMPFYPDSSGGAQQSSLYLFNSLRKLGWQVEVVCGCSLRSTYFRRTWWQAFKRFQKPSFVMMDEDLGYPCWRRVRKFSKEHHWLDWLDRHLREYKPDVVLGHNSPDCLLLKFAACQGYPSFYFVRSLTSIENGAVIPEKIHAIANSPFAASVTSQVTGKEVPVVLPFLDLDSYRVTNRERKYISFINPIPQKGIDVAIEIARRMPQKRFLFVEGKWARYNDNQRKAFMKNVYSLPNVDVWEYQWDMRQVYAVTDILLVPSQFTETFGRVIIEAQVNGIPVIAANVGGIPYTLGQGGILVEPKDDAQVYVDALHKLHDDESLYAHLSTLAVQNSERTEFDPNYQVENFIHSIESYSLK